MALKSHIIRVSRPATPTFSFFELASDEPVYVVNEQGQIIMRIIAKKDDLHRITPSFYLTLPYGVDVVLDRKNLSEEVPADMLEHIAHRPE